MKTILLVLCLALAAPGCQNLTAPTSVVTVAEATTLRSAAIAAKATMTTAAEALKAGKITVAQWQKLEAFHDKTFQVAYNLALKAAMSDLTLASPDMLSLLGQLAAIASSFNR